MNQTQRPTAIRKLVVFAAFAMAIVLYLDRFCIGFAERYIKEDLRLSDSQIGYLFAAFFLSYAAAQVPSGWLSDRFGGRMMLTIYIVAWSLFTAWMGLVAGFVAILLLRAGVGLGQAGAYPTAAGLIGVWMPPSRRGAASGVVSFGGRLGMFIAPILTAYLIVAFVPVGESSRFVEDDLLDLDRVADRFAAAALDESAIEPAHRVAGEIVAELDTASPRTAMPAAIVSALNAVLSRRDLCRHEDFDALKNCEREALTLVQRPREELTSAEVERLNRLYLEALFPAELRKVYVHGWRPVLVVYGLGGLAVAGLFWFIVRDRPGRHPACNPAEVELIASGRPAESEALRPADGLPMGALLSSFSMWMSCLAQFGTGFGWVFLGTWMSRYFSDVHEVPIIERGWMCGIPLVVGWVGMLSGGWLTDRLTRDYGRRWGRSLPIAVSRFVAMGAYFACLSHPSPWLAVAAFSLVALATDVGTPAAWAFNQDVGGRYIGSVLGWGNMWGNFAGALSPVVLRWLVDSQGSWDAAFVACGVAYLVAGVAAIGIDASRPIVRRHDDETLRERRA